MRLAAGLLLVVVAGHAVADHLSRVAAEDTTPATAAALVKAWLAAGAAERPACTRRLRAAGAPAAPALRAARKDANAATQKRIDVLLLRMRVDFERASTPSGMIYIPAGDLEVPRAKRPWGPSGARRAVPAFYIDRTEVTVARWRAWLAKLEAQEEGQPLRLGLRRPSPGKDGRLPVTRVRHGGALKFARAAGGRLPSADEFERALRGSGLSTYPWGETMRTGYANLRDHGPARVMPVGSYPLGVSPFGVLDLVGNVAEWSGTEVSQGTRGRYALLLGGSYTARPDPALTWRGQSRTRARIGPRERQPWIGFRLARTPPAFRR